MSRNASGTYTLPSASNPVVPGTTITTTWANTTLSDIATALTDSLDRNGKGEMNAALKIVAGSAGTPGLAFATDTDTGIYRVAANQLGVAAGGAAVAFFSATAMNLAYRFIQNLNSTFDLFTNTQAVSSLVGDATMATPVTVASSNKLVGTDYYLPADMGDATAIAHRITMKDASATGTTSTAIGVQANFTAPCATVNYAYGAQFNLDMSAAPGTVRPYGAYVDLTVGVGITNDGAFYAGKITGAANSIDGLRLTGDNSAAKLRYGVSADGTVRINSTFLYRKLQGASDGGNFALQADSSGVTNFSVDVNGALYSSAGANQVANLITSLSGAPATSTGADANRAFRLAGGSTQELAAGFFASNAGTWLQSRKSDDYATNRALVLQPNGGSVVVGSANATNIGNSQSVDSWGGSIRAQGASAAVGGGVGAEMDYSGGRGRFFCYDRSGAAYVGVDILGLTINLQANGATTASVTTTAIDLAAGKLLKVNGTQVLTARQTGWAAATGTATRTTFATGTVTTAQLAERVKALIDDLITHGVIGA